MDDWTNPVHRVLATREGLVDKRTATGHRIQPDRMKDNSRG